MVKTILPFLVGRRKLSSRKKKASAQGKTEPHHSDSSDISYTDIFKDLFTKDTPYNEQQPNGKGIYLLARMNDPVLFGLLLDYTFVHKFIFLELQIQWHQITALIRSQDHDPPPPLRK